MRIIILFTILTTCLFSANAQDTISYLSDPNAYQRVRFADFKHANISLSFEPQKGKVMGTVTLTFSPLRKALDSLYLDGVNMEIESISFNDQPLKMKRYPKGITLLFPKPLQMGKEYKVNIEYTCKPRRGMYFIGWDDPSGRSPKQIWSQGQGIDNRHWVPLFDDMADKITTDLLVRVPDSFKVLSNGKLLTQMKDNAGYTTWHWQMDKPHSPYLMMLGVGNYYVDTAVSASGVPLYRYMYPQWENRFNWTYRYDKEIFDFLEDEIGMDYPWEKYGQIPVQDFPYGAMENTSATVFGDFFCVDSFSYNDANYIYVNGHELAHQWFGDLVTSTSPKHHWLHESFATYYHHLVVKKFVGEDEFSKMMRDNQNAALAGSQRDFKGVGHSQAGSHRHYLKGSYVLKMLRYWVGDEAFRMGMQHYLAQHQFKTVNTEDLVKAFSESTGYSIGPFIDQWVYRGGEPHFKVEFETMKKEKQHRFIVDQLQDTASLVSTFKMPLVLEVHYTDGSSSQKRVALKTSLDTFLLDQKGKKISYVLFDPNSEILKSVDFERPEEWMVNQALKAENMIDRYDALVTLRNSESKDVVRAMHSIVNSNDFYLVRGEALKQLEKLNELSNEEIKSVISGSDIQLKKILMSSVQSLNPELREDYEKLLSAPSYDLIEIALVRLCSAFPQRIDYYLEQTETIYGTRGNNVRVQWLEIKYRNTQSKEALNELIDMTSNAFDFITRQKAMAALKRIDEYNDTLVLNLIQGIQKANWKLSSSSGKLLKHFYSQAEDKERFKTLLEGLKLSEAEKKRVERYLE